MLKAIAEEERAASGPPSPREVGRGGLGDHPQLRLRVEEGQFDLLGATAAENSLKPSPVGGSSSPSVPVEGEPKFFGAARWLEGGGRGP